MPHFGFRRLLLGQIAADEEVTPHRLRPCSHPVQRYGLSVLVDVTRLEAAHLSPAARRAHLAARAVEIVGMDEFDRAVSDHFRGLVTEDGPGARADLDEIPCRIRYQDEVLRSLEDATPFLDFLIERRLR